MLCLPTTLSELFKVRSLESKVLWKPSGPNIWWTQWRSLYKPRVLAGQGRDLLVLWLPKTSHICKFPCLLNLLLTNLKQLASFFILSLPSMDGGQFQISPGKPQIFRINSNALQNCFSWIVVLNCSLVWCHQPISRIEAVIVLILLLLGRVLFISSYLFIRSSGRNHCLILSTKVNYSSSK